MRCTRRLIYFKLISCFIFSISLSLLIALITLFNHRSTLLIKNSDPNNHRNGCPKPPGEYMRHLKPNNQSYCKFKYNLPHSFIYKDDDLFSSPELKTRSPYRILYNVLEAINPWNLSSDLYDGVTYATHITPEYLNFIPELIRYWDGLISLAAFVPDKDADYVIRKLLKMCHCLPDMARVSVHFVFPKKIRPYLNTDNYGSVMNCFMENAGYATGGAGGQSTLETYRNTHGLVYPVNVARNVARTAVRTRHILVSDVELLPSQNLSHRFFKMLKNYDEKYFLYNTVYVLPVFEIEQFEEIPRTKTKLLELIRKEKAVYFHRHVCLHCQKFPGLEIWIQQSISNSEQIKPLLTVKREHPYHRWEPIYIGTKEEPFYSETLSWEGKQDKMTQMMEMCLKGYRFVILDNAFLIHWPGVKRKRNLFTPDASDASNGWRTPYILKNTRQYNLIVNNLAKRYTRNRKCKLQ